MAQLGKYEILENLGTGSMGTVSRARDTVLDREVALKTIRTGVEVEPELRERFYREARACGRLQHPGIVAVYDLGEVDSTAFIAMELLVGSDLRKLIERRAEIPLITKIKAMITVCQALGHAHRHGITHRDIKPSNLFLLEDGRAKVLDFGIARLPTSQLTVAGKILGTPNYMAPEQILAKPTDSRSDLFSAAVVFFEFLVYAHPFQSRLIPRRIADDDPDSLFDHDSKMPLLLDRVLRRGLVKNPDERYKTGDEFADDLSAVLDSVSQNASPSFSQVELPSDRKPVGAVSPEAAPDPAFVPDPTLLHNPPAGEDPHEWRLSEVLRLIPEFEGAIDSRDKPRATRLFKELVTIQSVDPRFSEAVELCRSKLGEIDAQASNVNPPTPEPVSPPVVPSGSDAWPDPTRSFDPDSILQNRPPFELPQPPPPAPEPNVRRLDKQPAPPPNPPARPSAISNLLQNLTSAQKRMMIVAAGTIVIIVLMAIGLTYIIRPEEVEPSVATVLVGAEKTGLARNAGDQTFFLELVTGQKLNIQQLPGPNQEWIRAQFVPNPSNASRPGYVRIADLDHRSWLTSSPEDRLALIRMFHAGGPPGGQAEIEALQNLIQEYPNDQVARDAHSEIARILLDDLRRQRQSGVDAQTLSNLLGSVVANNAAGSEDSSLREQIEAEGAIIAELLQPKPPEPVIKPPRPPKPPPVPDPPPPRGDSRSLSTAQIEDKLRSANDLITDHGESAEARRVMAQQAERLVRDVLAARPDYSGVDKNRVDDLLTRIDRVRRLLSQ